MRTIELQIPDDLAERLAPYRDQLPTLLETGLRTWREGLAAVPLQMPAALQARLHALLDKERAGAPLTFEERQEAAALAELAERVSLKQALAERIRSVLAGSDWVIAPTPEHDPEAYVRQTPVPITGKPVSEIVIEQRGDR